MQVHLNRIAPRAVPRQTGEDRSTIWTAVAKPGWVFVELRPASHGLCQVLAYGRLGLAPLNHAGVPFPRDRRAIVWWLRAAVLPTSTFCRRRCVRAISHRLRQLDRSGGEKMRLGVYAQVTDGFAGSAAFDPYLSDIVNTLEAASHRNAYPRRRHEPDVGGYKEALNRSRDS